MFFVECASSSSTPPTSDLADETFTITTSTALFALKDDLDFETTTAYYFLMTVVDKGLTPMLTGSIAIRVAIHSTYPLKRQTKIAADDTLIFLLLSFEENKACCFM